MSTNEHSQTATMSPVAEEAIEPAELVPGADGDSEKGAAVQRLAAIENLEFSSEELTAIDEFAVESDINLWAQNV